MVCMISNLCVGSLAHKHVYTVTLHGVTCGTPPSKRKVFSLAPVRSKKDAEQDPYVKISNFASKLARLEEARLLAAMQDAATQDELRQRREVAAHTDRRYCQQQQKQLQQQTKEPSGPRGKLERSRSDADVTTSRQAYEYEGLPSSGIDKTQTDEDVCQRRREAGGSGSTDRAAGFLANVMANAADDKDSQSLRPEEFTRRQEEERKHNVEIITVDQNYVPSKEGEAYQPSIATWGLFPRPNDISKAYGGGRTLRPGQALESDESREARTKRVTEALAKFKKDSGAEVDPAVLAQAQQAMDQGRRMFDDGDLREAVPSFRQASVLMPLPSVVGGEARLQLAVSLDSLGHNDEAKKLYTQLKNHPSALVSKTAKRLLGGFQAAAFLKADQISYRADTQVYQQYFTAVESFYDYAAGGNDETADLRLPLAISVAIIAAPLIIIGCRIVLVAK